MEQATPDELQIRESVTTDIAVIESLYPDAFPEEDLVPLIRSLLCDSRIALSLVATIGSEIAGHAIFTECGVAGSRVRAALLGPLAVTPKHRRQGVGSAMVYAGLRRLEDAGVRLVCVLGDPAYYSRLGFAPEKLVEPPYALPIEWESAWQSQYLGRTTVPCTGKLSVPKQWLDPALWAP